jgi:hypothetical protein
MSAECRAATPPAAGATFVVWMVAGAAAEELVCSTQAK